MQEEGRVGRLLQIRGLGIFFFYGALDETPIVSVSVKAAQEVWSVLAERWETRDYRRLSGPKYPHRRAVFFNQMPSDLFPPTPLPGLSQEPAE